MTTGDNEQLAEARAEVEYWLKVNLSELLSKSERELYTSFTRFWIDANPLEPIAINWGKWASGLPTETLLKIKDRLYLCLAILSELEGRRSEAQAPGPAGAGLKATLDRLKAWGPIKE